MFECASENVTPRTSVMHQMDPAAPRAKAPRRAHPGTEPLFTCLFAGTAHTADSRETGVNKNAELFPTPNFSTVLSLVCNVTVFFIYLTLRISLQLDGKFLEMVL